MQKLVARFLKDESGATAIEYGVLAGLISVVIIGAATLLGETLAGLFRTIEAALAAVQVNPNK